MKKIVNDITKIRLITAFVSLLLSTFLIYSDDVINSDGILYMDMAQAFLQGGLIETAKLFNWPFFSILVAYLHQLTALPFETTAYVINALLAVLLTDTLLLISHKILPNTRQLAIGALLILSFYSLNEYRDFIIRDMGYWAFCSLSLYYFIRHLESSSMKNATLWQLFALTAILFRVEGVFILLALPLYYFILQPPITAIKKILQLNYLVIIGGIVSLYTSLSSIGGTSASAFDRITSIFYYSDIQNTLDQITLRAAILEAQVLNDRTAEYGALILISGLLIMLVFKLIKAISFGYLAIFVTSMWQQTHSQTNNANIRLIRYFVAIHLVILVVFLFKEYFLSTRYTMMVLLSLLLLMLPKITSWIDEAWNTKNKYKLAFIGFILFISIADTSTSSISKIYIKNTAIWAGNNIPVQSSILAGNSFSHYYFKINNNHHQIKLAKHRKKKGHKYLTKNYQKYDYLLTIEKRKDTELLLLLNKMQLESIYCEQNKRGDKSCVYKILH
ncbi:MAG: hypothetical protein ACKE9I_03485 [Methylophagaceae bacterium]